MRYILQVNTETFVLIIDSNYTAGKLRNKLKVCSYDMQNYVNHRKININFV